MAGGVAKLWRWLIPIGLVAVILAHKRKAMAFPTPEDRPNTPPQDLTPGSRETLQAYLTRQGITHFTANEVTRLHRWNRNVTPNRSLWPNIVPTLLMAELLRARLGYPLTVGNGYRPRDYNTAVGGASQSQHIQFRAVDLDMPSSVTGAAAERRFHEESARIWATVGRGLKMGMGFYNGSDRRVHIDTGFNYRSWDGDNVTRVVDALGLR